MCYIDGQKNKYSALNECNRMLKYNLFNNVGLIPLRKLGHTEYTAQIWMGKKMLVKSGL
jgi:hypothetical protein